MGNGEATRFAAVLYVSDQSATCERAIETLRAVAERLNLAPTTYQVRNVSTEPLREDERCRIVITPTLLTSVPSERCIAAELDDIDELERALRGMLRRWAR